MSSLPLAMSSTAMFVVLAAVVATIYATGMVITRRRLRKFRNPSSSENNGQKH